MKTQWLYNPFRYIAGPESLLIGLLILAATAVAAYVSGTHFYGFLDIETIFSKDSEFWLYALELALHWLLLASLFTIAGKIFSSSSIRIIDVFGTTILAATPLLLTPVIRLIPGLQTFLYRSPEMYGLIVIYLLSLTWSYLLCYHAFRISCNLKDEKLTFSFILCVLIAEFLFKVLIIQIK